MGGKRSDKSYQVPLYVSIIVLNRVFSISLILSQNCFPFQGVLDIPLEKIGVSCIQSESSLYYLDEFMRKALILQLD